MTVISYCDRMSVSWLFLSEIEDEKRRIRKLLVQLSGDLVHVNLVSFVVKHICREASIESALSKSQYTADPRRPKEIGKAIDFSKLVPEYWLPHPSKRLSIFTSCPEPELRVMDSKTRELEVKD